MEPVSASTNLGLRTNHQLRARGRRGWTQILCMFGVLALLGAVVGRTAAADAEPSPTDAVGRLIIDDQRLCTAFIVWSDVRQVSDGFGGRSTVYENWLATAGHCHGGNLVFQHRGQAYPTRVIGFSAGRTNGGFDVMVMSFVTDRRLPTLEPAFGEYPQVGDPLMLVGYGSRALMMRVGPLLRYDERGHMEIRGYASRGNSGGPVLIPGTWRIVGIGIKTTLDEPEGASFIYCILAICEVKPPHTAAHIDRLKGLANFH